MSFRTLISVLALSLSLTACDRHDYEGVMKGTVEEMEQMVTVLKGVRDESSSKAGAAKIQDITKNLQQYKAKAEKMPKPSAAEEKRLQDKYQPRIQKASADVTGEAMRITRDPKLMTPELRSAIQGMSAINKK